MADAVRLTREGLGELLRARGLDATLCSGRPAEIEAALGGGDIDVVVLNAATVDLVAAAAAVRSIAALPLVAMSVSQTVADVALCAELDLAGFILADDSVDDLVELIGSADQVRVQCPLRAIPMLMQAVRKGADAAFERARLTRRESEIARLLEQGLANKEIASRLGITTRTVKNHLHHVYDKLGVHTRAEVTALLSGRRNLT